MPRLLFKLFILLLVVFVLFELFISLGDIDQSKIETAQALTKNWSFGNASYYDFNSAEIEVSGGVAKLKYTPPSSVTINPAADAWVYQNAPTTNYGTYAYSYVGYTQTCRTYLIFDLTFIPPGSTINSAALSLYTSYLNGVRSQTIYRSSASWDELTIIWNNQPGYTGAGIDSITVDTYAWYDLDVTSSVQDFVDGSYSNNGWVIIADAGDNPYTRWETKEGTVGRWPKLEINYGIGIYSSTNPSINPITSYSQSFIQLYSFSETAAKNGGEIYYQISNDGGITWYYWNGSAWVTAGADNYNIAVEVNENISEFSTGAGLFNFKAFLSSDGTQDVQLDEISLGYQGDPPTALGPSVSNFAWSENIGWISHNSQDTGSAVEYGVNIEDDGNLTGYAWSDNIGWVDYNPGGPYPGSPSYSAKYDFWTRQISGWTQIVDWGDDGWISMRGISPEHGVDIASDGRFSGWAWNNAIGWIEYDHSYGSVETTIQSIDTPPDTPVLIQPINNIDTYFVYPNQALTPILDWSDFSDPDPGDSQSTYHIQVDDNSDFSSLFIDYIPMFSSSSAFTVPSGDLVYNQIYYWRVRVQDQGGKWSEWGVRGAGGENNSFRTPLHAPPDAKFEFDPPEPSAGVEIQFTDISVAYGGSSIVYWRWNFGDGTIIEGSEEESQNPLYTFEEEGDYIVTLLVRDSDDYENEITIPLNIKLPLPEIWKKVIPR